MKPGDYAGLAAFQNTYGMIGVKMESDGKNHFIMAKNGGDGNPIEITSTPLIVTLALLCSILTKFYFLSITAAPSELFIGVAFLSFHIELSPFSLTATTAK